MTDRPATSPGNPLLVFGDDGSPTADIGWLWINNHPWPDWRIEIVTAGEPQYPPAQWGTAPGLEEWSPPWGRDSTRPAGIVSLRSVTAPGDPRVLLGDRHDADLVVVGPRGLGGHLRALWSGSTTEWLLAHPPAPLAVIRSAARAKDVVVCVDGSEHATAALDAFLRLPLAAEATVTVLAVQDRWAETDAGVAAARSRLEAAGITATPVEVRGGPTEAILEHLHHHRPQLVVLGLRGLTGLKRLQVGSTASAVVRGAECSTLVAHAGPEPRTQ